MIATVRFWIKGSQYPDGILYQARGPYGMTGHWCEGETEAKRELLAMFGQVSNLSDRELEAANSLYEELNDL